MSTPGIELRWGHGFEENLRKREIVRPFINEAFELAGEGIDELGLSLSGRKYVVIDQKEPNDRWNGEAQGKTCHLLINREDIKRRRIDTVWLAAFLCHELVHLAHEEYVKEDGMLIHAAAEGIAHIAQYDFANTLLESRGRKGPTLRYVEKIRALPKREAAKLELDFWKASAKPGADEFDNLVKWFRQFPRPLGFPKGAAFGIIAVTRQLNQGREISELVSLPPEEVLDVA